MLFTPQPRLRKTPMDEQCRCIIAPATDVIIQNDAYIINCVMPGLNPDDINLYVKNNELALHAAAKLDMTPGLRVYAMEFSSTCYRMRLALPQRLPTPKHDR